MNKTKALSIIFTILTIFIILQSIFITVLILSSNNRYKEPVIGDTMLLAIREDHKTSDYFGSLAIVDLALDAKGEDSVVFLGGTTHITKDKMAAIGKVKFYIPLLGSYIDFFRAPFGFFALIILPLVLLVIRHSVLLALKIKSSRAKEQE